jgi:subtilisin family serine protease
MTEVVVTLKAPPLAAFGRSLLSASHTAYLARMEAAQNAAVQRVEARIPGATVRWRYHLVADGFAVDLPRSALGALASLPGVTVWPNVRYHALRADANVHQIGADQLWGAGLATAGQGMKIGIIDDGLDASNPFFTPSGYTYPAGFPRGQTKYTTPKVIVQRTFPPPGNTYRNATLPFDPAQSYHATHVAGIAAGDYDTDAHGQLISGVAPRAYLGNYKALTTPTPGFGLDGNSAEITAAIEAAVSDGMNVINLSLGEPEVEPSRDIVVRAIDAAAAAGVVPVVAAGNDFDDFGYGSVSSPANAPDAISVAAVTADNEIADFSSAGPTPISLQMKPDISAPGVDILSSFPPSHGTFGLLSGTSMAAPHIAGAAALLKERHPTWTVAQIKSALVLTGDPVRSPSGSEVLSIREGGGVADLVKADAPLVFAAPTGLSFGELAPGATATRSVTLTDAGGGSGVWGAAALVQQGPGTVAVAPAVTVPGTLSVTATAGSTSGDVAGFVVLTRNGDSRRIPFWFETSAPKLAGEAKTTLRRPGAYRGTTAGAPSLVTEYRYPTGGDVVYPGPERAYRIVVNGSPANVGVVVTSGRTVPHITLDGDESRLQGYPALPQDINPYRRSYGDPTRTAGLILPRAGAYDVVFDTRSAADAGPFAFRYWVNDVTPPRLRVVSLRGGISVSAIDRQSGVDPASVAATLDGKSVHAVWRADAFHIPASRGRHALVLTVSDYQETKNMEDVAKILPNTATLRATVRVR